MWDQNGKEYQNFGSKFWHQGDYYNIIFRNLICVKFHRFTLKKIRNPWNYRIFWEMGSSERASHTKNVLGHPLASCIFQIWAFWKLTKSKIFMNFNVCKILPTLSHLIHAHLWYLLHHRFIARVCSFHVRKEELISLSRKFFKLSHVQILEFSSWHFWLNEPWKS